MSSYTPVYLLVVHIMVSNNITHACKYVRVCAPPRPYITSGVILTLYDWLDFCCFSVPFMALAVDVIDRGVY